MVFRSVSIEIHTDSIYPEMHLIARAREVMDSIPKILHDVNLGAIEDFSFSPASSPHMYDNALSFRFPADVT